MRESPPKSSRPASSVREAGAPEGDYAPGKVVGGKYELIRPLGQGGMGTVWVAQNTVLDVSVAIKLLTVHSGANTAKVTQRMLQEARTAAQLVHPAICRALDFGETEYGEPFVISELMHGESLADVLDVQERFPATTAVQMLLPIIDGLAVAHAHGIVHRDVKPDNIFLARDVAQRMQPKLLDFGIARFVESDTQITVDGSLLGTPNYMSPEQARGKGGADFRTDVWSVCVVLYEMMTGEVPFEDDNYNAILWAVINETPRSIVELGAGDQSLWRLLERGLRKAPEQRWQSVRELGEALALWLYNQGEREDVCGSSLRRNWIESGLSDVQMELPDSERPPASRLSVAGGRHPSHDSADGTATVRPPSGETVPTLSDTTRQITLDARRVRIGMIAIGVALALAIAAVVAFSVGGDDGAESLTAPVSAAAPEAKTTPTEPTAKPAVGADGEPIVTPSDLPIEKTDPDEDLAAKAPAPGRPATAPKHATAPKPAATPKPVATPKPATKPAPAGGVDRDFGF